MITTEFLIYSCCELQINVILLCCQAFSKSNIFFYQFQINNFYCDIKEYITIDQIAKIK